MKIKKKCKHLKCSREFEIEDSGYQKNYCSSRCANSRVHTKSSNAKRSKKAKNNWKNFTQETKNKIIQTLINGKKIRKQNYLTKISETPTELLSHQSRKLKVFYEQDCKCNKCKLIDWLGQPLTFELEHKDGNKNNNIRENLEVLCPNCHSQTLTWRGRNNRVNMRP